MARISTYLGIGAILAGAIAATGIGIYVGRQQRREATVVNNRLKGLEDKLAAAEKAVDAAKIDARIRQEVNTRVEAALKERIGASGKVTVAQYDPSQNRFVPVQPATLGDVAFKPETVTNEYLASKAGFEFEYTRNMHDPSPSATAALDDQLAKQRLVPIEGDGIRYALVDDQSAETPATARVTYTFEVEAVGDPSQNLSIRNWGSVRGVTTIISSLTVIVDEKGIHDVIIDDDVHNTTLHLHRNSKGEVEYPPQFVDEKTARAIFDMGGRAFYGFKEKQGIDARIQAYTPKLDVQFELQSTE